MVDGNSWSDRKFDPRLGKVIPEYISDLDIDFPNFDLSNVDLSMYSTSSLEGLSTPRFSLDRVILDIPPKEEVLEKPFVIPEVVRENPIQIPEESYDQDWLCKTVAQALNETGFKPNHAPRVLSIGTGPCGLEEYHAMIRYFSDMDFRVSEYTVIDIEEKNLNRTRELIEKFPVVNIICDDARNLPYLVEGEYDVVLMRHPDCECGEELGFVWKDIFEKVKDQIGPDSRLITTAFWDMGYGMIFNMLRETGYDIKLLGENENPGRDLKSTIKSVSDKYLIVAAK
jgi:hypothetical protein